MVLSCGDLFYEKNTYYLFIAFFVQSVVSTFLEGGQNVHPCTI